VLLPPDGVAEALWDRMAALDVLPPPR
jgi:hypothetical protein